MGTQTKILLDETEMPTKWYNIVADLPEPPPPPLHPGTHQPATGADFDALFPKALIEQEMSWGALYRYPRGSSGSIQALETQSIIQGAQIREATRYAGERYTTNTRALARQVLTSQILPFRRSGTTLKKASKNSQLKLELASGARLLPSLAHNLGLNARYGR